MESHEQYCKALKIAVKTYTLAELNDGLNMSKANINYADYAEIFKAEIALRNQRK